MPLYNKNHEMNERSYKLLHINNTYMIMGNFKYVDNGKITNNIFVKLLRRNPKTLTFNYRDKIIRINKDDIITIDEMDEEDYKQNQLEITEKEQRHQIDLKDKVKRIVRDEYDGRRRVFEDTFQNELEVLRKSGNTEFIDEMVELIKYNIDEMDISGIFKEYLHNIFLHI